MNNQWANLLIVCMFFVVLSSQSDAYVPSQEYKDVRVKFYGDIISEEGCIEIFDRIPEEYYEDLNYIRVFEWNKNRVHGGYYWWQTKMIDLFEDCNLETLIHELAHHKQIKVGDNFEEIMRHRGNFNGIEREIWEKVKA